MKLAWASDIHLNFADATKQRWFIHTVKEHADALVISGDIGESVGLCEILDRFNKWFNKPVYFVLGNHDFYRDSIKKVRLRVSRHAYSTKNLFYMTNSPTIELSPTTAIVGHDGWGDGRFGDLERSTAMLNDFLLIKEVRHWRGDELNKAALRKVLMQLGDEAAEYFKLALPGATSYPNLFVVTHVPPFREAAWHEGQQSDDHFAPYFACKAVGDVLLEAAKRAPKCQITVLCGHTHSGGEVQMADNLRILTAPAKYANPKIERIFTID